jgi:hypothetical protein
MDVVVCDVELWAVEKVMMSSIWHEEEEGMRTGYRYETAFCDVVHCTV